MSESSQPDIQAEANLLLDTTKQLEIKDEPSHELAMERLTAIVELKRKIREYHEPLKAKAYEAHRAVCEAESRMLAPVMQAENYLRQAISEYRASIRRLEIERAQKAQEEAELLAAEALEAKIEQAEANGASAAEVQVLIDQHVPVPVSVPGKRFDGDVRTWQAEVVDIRELCRAIASGTAPPTYVTPNIAALNGVARSTRGALKIPGVRIFEQTKIRVQVRRSRGIHV
jgi:hypothetical protein